MRYVNHGAIARVTVYINGKGEADGMVFAVSKVSNNQKQFTVSCADVITVYAAALDFARGQNEHVFCTQETADNMKGLGIPVENDWIILAGAEELFDMKGGLAWPH